MRTHNTPPCYGKIKEILIMPPDRALLSTLIGSNYPCLELIFMVPKEVRLYMILQQCLFDIFADPVSSCPCYAGKVSLSYI